MLHPLRQHIEQITPLSDKEFEYILSHFTRKKVRRHQFLIEEAELVPYEFFVVQGCLKAFHTDRNGKEHIIQFALEGWWISDYQAFFNQGPATMLLSSLEEGELLTISLANRNKLCAEMHKIEHFFRLKITAGFIAMQQRILAGMNLSVQERYEKLLKLYPDLAQRVPKQDIAAYLGVSRETLSRLRS
ncbi:Crp/Fnr family transcriptional regulator [Hymenobacter crusticola]|uniref:Crp/Fnr family transcriptional regulator n=1 Tax=Hymenobacter crusticola TaxID=1770526 RepID=A0A243WAY4_9BACT|nr:Crp/Fnr family transcriptional regulator [Hymenobacter crusticola]OUJ72726.1 Crp/Fnr family transcriptional regulator [Hymenobacter crusticola]